MPNLNDDYFWSIEEAHSVREVRPHAQVAPVELRALERVHGGGGGLGVAVLDDGRARGPLGPAAREEATSPDATSPDDALVVRHELVLSVVSRLRFITKILCGSTTLSTTLRRVFGMASLAAPFCLSRAILLRGRPRHGHFRGRSTTAKKSGRDDLPLP